MAEKFEQPRKRNPDFLDGFEWEQYEARNIREVLDGVPGDWIKEALRNGDSVMLKYEAFKVHVIPEYSVTQSYIPDGHIVFGTHVENGKYINKDDGITNVVEQRVILFRPDLTNSEQCVIFRSKVTAQAEGTPAPAAVDDPTKEDRYGLFKDWNNRDAQGGPSSEDPNRQVEETRRRVILTIFL